MFGTYRNGYRAILLLVALYCLVAVWITGNPVFFLFDDRPSATFLIVWLLPLIAWYALVGARLIVRRRPRPLHRIRRYTGLNRAWLGRAVLLVGALVLWASAFTILKVNIPNLVPYHADPALIAIDRALFGIDPWRLTHALIGESGTVFLDRAYAGWFFALIGCMAYVIQTRNAQLQVISLLTLIMVWLVLGVGLATALASVGPCYAAAFFGIPDFDPLMAQLRGNATPLIALQAMDYLASVQGKTAYAAGISAMPSLHVAMAVWFVLVAHAATPNRLPVILAAIYALIIFVGSVHLGWHYAADGIVSAIVTPAIWWLARKFVTIAPSGESAIQGNLQPCAN